MRCRRGSLGGVVTLATNKIYPVSALLAVMGNKAPEEIAVAMDVSERTVFRWQEGLLLTERQADRLAVRSGHHPAELWPDWYLTAK